MYDKRLETFITVADTGSFSKAAETLYISVPALSKQISTLEKVFTGVPRLTSDKSRGIIIQRR